MTRSLALTALVAAIVSAACSGVAIPSSPPSAVATSDPHACGPGTSDGPPSYPGWPGSAADLIPVVVSPELAVGANRFQFTLIDDQNRPIASSDLKADISFFDLAADPATPTASTSAEFMEAVEGRGLYTAPVEFRCSGDWGAEIRARIPDGEERSARVVFPVRPDSATPSVGEAVPATETPTAETPDAIAAISTDPRPDPDFYRISEAQAVAEGKPFVLVFATPAFCQTATCGPTLDVVKSAATDFKDELAFIHVEPYVLELRDGQLQPVLDEANQLQAVPQVREWGLPAEPYIFVVGANGQLSSKFAGLVSEDELRAAFQVASGAP